MEGWKKIPPISAGLALTSILVAAILSLTSGFSSCFGGPYVYHRVLEALIPEGIIHQWLALLAIPAVLGVSLILAGIMLRGRK